MPPAPGQLSIYISFAALLISLISAGLSIFFSARADRRATYAADARVRLICIQYENRSDDLWYLHNPSEKPAESITLMSSWHSFFEKRELCSIPYLLPDQFVLVPDGLLPPVSASVTHRTSGGHGYPVRILWTNPQGRYSSIRAFPHGEETLNLPPSIGELMREAPAGASLLPFLEAHPVASATSAAPVGGR